MGQSVGDRRVRVRAPLFHFRNWNGARIGIVSIIVAKHDVVISIIEQELAKGCYDTITGLNILPSLADICNRTTAGMKGTTACDITAATVLTAK